MQNHNVNMNRCLGEPEACKTARRCAAVLMVMLVGLLATANTALAHVTMQLDPFGEASAAGKDILDLRRVTVVIFGSDHLNPKDVEKKTLRLGSRDTVGAQPKSFRRRLRDVNGDGFKDRLAVFDLSRTGLQADRHIDAVLIGSLRDGTAFVAYDSVLRGDEPVDSCSFFSNVDVMGFHCSYSSSLVPLDLQTLIDDINDDLVESGRVGVSINDSSAVAVEAWSGRGHPGKTELCGLGFKIKGGGGGGRGYARTVLTVGDLFGQLSNATDLYLYVGKNGPNHQNGGSSSVVIGQELSTTNITDDDDAKDPSGEFVLAISGAGGGGGKGHCVGGTANVGYHGGAGGVSVAPTTADASNAGDNGGTGNKGFGGNDRGDGNGGPKSLHDDGSDAGADGIGGFGDSGEAMFVGSGLSSWAFGQGGIGGNDGGAGGGGGGFGGGGGGGGGEDHLGGGGGGGSWARQSTTVVNSSFWLGSSYDPGKPQVTLTFQAIGE